MHSLLSQGVEAGAYSRTEREKNRETPGRTSSFWLTEQ